MISVIDASVAVEYLLRTELGESVTPLLEMASLSAPELLDAEVLAVLQREVERKRLKAGRASEAIQDLRDWEVERISHRELVEDAWRLRGRLSAYDAFYVAAARLRHATLITADGPLSRAPSLGIAIQNIRTP
jgi:predicted nucleic acid-binding protein